MNADTIKLFVGSLVRHALGAFGGGLLANGVITQGDIEIVSGAVAIGVTIVWSLLQKKKVS